MSQRDDRREQGQTAFNADVDAVVSSGSLTAKYSALFDSSLAGVTDPYTLYARLRAEDPIHRTPHGLWVLTRIRHARYFTLQLANSNSPKAT
jgi:hypothetical protein